jgi:hypothetical protein
MYAVSLCSSIIGSHGIRTLLAVLFVWLPAAVTAAVQAALQPKHIMHLGPTYRVCCAAQPVKSVSRVAACSLAA